jgi:hypothetical protein
MLSLPLLLVHGVLHPVAFCVLFTDWRNTIKLCRTRASLCILGVLCVIGDLYFVHWTGDLPWQWTVLGFPVAILIVRYDDVVRKYWPNVRYLVLVRFTQDLLLFVLIVLILLQVLYAHVYLAFFGACVRLLDEVSDRSSTDTVLSCRNSWDLYWATLCELLLPPLDCDVLTRSPCTWRKLGRLAGQAFGRMKLPLVLALGFLLLQILLLWNFATVVVACGFCVLTSLMWLVGLHVLASVACRVHVDGCFSGVRVENALARMARWRMRMTAYQVRMETYRALLEARVPKALIDLIVDF